MTPGVFQRNLIAIPLKNLPRGGCCAMDRYAGATAFGNRVVFFRLADTSVFLR